MNNGRVFYQSLIAVLTFVPYVIWGALIRRGTIRDRGILWSGLLLTLFAMGAAAAMLWPDYSARRVPLGLLIGQMLLMACVTGFCVMLSYRNQRTEDIATYTIGDTKIIVRIAPVSRLPDAHALLLPTLTSLKMIDGLAGVVRLGSGPGPEAELARQGPVGIGKVLRTGGGTTSVGAIFHVAVADALRPTDPEKLRRGLESAAQQARKAKSELVAAPVGPLRGLSAIAASEAIAAGVLRQRKAFAEIVFVVLEARHAKDAAAGIAKAVAAVPDAPAQASGRPS